MTLGVHPHSAAALSNITLNRCLQLLELNFSQTDLPPECLSALENGTDATLNGTAMTFELPAWQQLSFIMCFSLIVFAGAVGNAIVIWIVLAHQRMRSVTNYFLVNLSVADMTTAMFNVIFNAVFMMHSHWPFGQTYCKVTNFISLLTVSSSVFTITAMSIDRCIAIYKPLSHRMSRKCALIIIALIWFVSVVIALPGYVFADTSTYPPQNDRVVCSLLFPALGSFTSEQVDFVYNVVFMIVTYFIPMFTMAIAYSIMGHVLWRSKGIGEQTERQKEAIRSKQRVVRMLVVVVLIFAVCWLPYHLYFIFTCLDPAVTYSSWAQPLYLIIYWLAMSNCMYNPFIYYWMNSRFRSYFRFVLCYCCNLGSGLGHKCSEVERLQSDWTFNNNSPHRRTLKSQTGTECLVLTAVHRNGAYQRGHQARKANDASPLRPAVHKAPEDKLRLEE
ncbi:tachykinin-like peptides receptor 86C [Galendromus occidentalis]|uniref:Tachykinin-like peptides receptor 86C n=1 Tax=Galendromus occidentalis TaxID=34638 RepID=A0AAJ6QLU7_9ACAR|nr:tachykinin-like peptides receptor 86C [Galendromus occidentalis]